MIKVLLFAQLAELGEADSLMVEFETGMTPRSLVASQVGTWPKTLTDALIYDVAMVAANEVMIDWDQTLSDEDVVAFLPPFSGG